MLRTLVLTTAVAFPLAGQQDVLLLMRGADTIAVEQFAFTETTLQAELLFKAAGARFTYTLQFGPDLRVTRMENAVRRAADDPTAPAAQSAVLEFRNDSAIVTIAPSGQVQAFAATGDAIPFLNPSFALVEVATRRFRHQSASNLSVPMFAVQGGQTFPLPLLSGTAGPDTVIANLGGVEARLAVDREGRITGGRIPAQGLELRRTTASGRAALQEEAPDYSAPTDAPYTAEDVRVPTPMGHRLAGTLTLPKHRAGPVAGVVTITGSGGQDRDESLSIVPGYRPFAELADTLGRAGIAVLRMDDRGIGLSEGNAAAATSRDFADDIAAGVAYLRSRPEVDPDRIMLVGHSEGGLIAPLLAAEDARLRGIALLAGPSRSGRTILEYQNRNALAHSPKLTDAVRDSLLHASMDSVESMASRQPWMRYFLSYDPIATARTVRTPVLILQGGTDQQITPEQAGELAAAFRAGGNQNVTVKVFANANHLFLNDPDGFPGGYGSLKDVRLRGDVVETLVVWLRRQAANHSAMPD